jgi:hypothetical protein
LPGKHSRSEFLRDFAGDGAEQPFVEGKERRMPSESARAPRTLSVIIAARPSDVVLAPIETIGSWRRPWVIEVLVARGEVPSAQRNAAAALASGDLLLFLDDDSEPSSDLIDAYMAAFTSEPVAVAVGGPAAYRAESYLGRLGAAVLSEPLVTGRSASRYAPRGARRASDERELILCNLALRRSTFEKAGGFDELLYPNEENLLLQRLLEHGDKVLYEPAALVRRPAPRAGRKLAKKVFGYGRGRAAQARRRLSWTSSARVSLALAAFLSVFTTVAALPWNVWPVLVLGLVLSLYYGVLAARISRREGLFVGLAAAPVACLTHIAYAAGILLGLFWQPRMRRGEVTVENFA